MGDAPARQTEWMRARGAVSQGLTSGHRKRKKGIPMLTGPLDQIRRRICRADGRVFLAHEGNCYQAAQVAWRFPVTLRLQDYRRIGLQLNKTAPPPSATGGRFASVGAVHFACPRGGQRNASGQELSAIHAHVPANGGDLIIAWLDTSAAHRSRQTSPCLVAARPRIEPSMNSE